MKKEQKDKKNSAARRTFHKRRQSAYLKCLTVVVFGDTRVGKTSLIRGFCDGSFTEEYEATIEDFFTKQILHNDKTYIFDIIDTCGSENFPAMRKVDIEKADAAVLVYSPDRKRSFEQLVQFRDEILEQKGFSIPIVVVANKSDLALDNSALKITDKSGCVVNTRDVVLKQWRHMWTFTSAKMGWSMSDPFLMIVDDLQRRKEEAENTHNASLKIKRSTSWLSFGSALTLRRTRSTQANLNE